MIELTLNMSALNNYKHNLKHVMLLADTNFVIQYNVITEKKGFSKNIMYDNE